MPAVTPGIPRPPCLLVGLCLAVTALAGTGRAQAPRDEAEARWFARGKEALQAGDLATARSSFEKVLEKYPTHPYSRHYLARIAAVEKERARREEASRRTGPVLATVDLRHVSLAEGLDYLRARAREESGRAPNYVVAPALPGKSMPPLSLHLARIPAAEAARYLAIVAGAAMRPEASATVFRPDDDGRWEPRPSRRHRQVLASARLSRISARDLDLDEAVRVLREIASPQVALNAVIVPPLPTADGEDPAPPARFALDLEDVTLADALELIAELAGVAVVYESHGVVLSPPERIEEGPGAPDAPAATNGIRQ